MTKATKHYCDTSIVRPYLAGTSKYKAYLQRELDPERLYASPYIRMEFWRSLVNDAIQFYFSLDLDTVVSVSDAIELWSQHFEARKSKNLLTIMAALLTAHALSEDSETDKEKAKRALGAWIKRISRRFNKSFKDTGMDRTSCTRAKVKLPFVSGDPSDAFKRFSDEFNDLKGCRAKCRVDTFFLQTFRDKSDAIVTAGAKAKGQQNRGFKRLGESIDKRVSKGANGYTCRNCGAVGDAVIAIDTPPGMRLEHIDFAFGGLADELGFEHCQYPSVTALMRRSDGGE